MGRRLNISTPTVIQTMLPPLSDNFSIEASDTIEQWYYANDSTYKPDRSTYPLLLTPKITAIDTNTGTSYTPSWLVVNWYFWNTQDNTDYSSSDTLWPGLHWTPIPYSPVQITGAVYEYPSQNNPTRSLTVKKNVPPASTGASETGQPICCVAKYIDPRDSAVTVTVKGTVTLVTNQDSTTERYTVNLLAPTKTLFNPLTDNSTYTFQVQVLDENNEDVTDEHYIVWNALVYGVGRISNIEVPVNLLECYKQATQQTGKGQGKDTITIDAMYVEHIDLIVYIRATTSASSDVLPFKARCSLLWDFPRIDATTICDNGRAVNDNERPMKFSNIINHHSGVLTDAQKREHFLFNYKARVPEVQGNIVSFADKDMGWGQSIEVSSEELRQHTTYSTPVHAECYMLGPWDTVTEDGVAVTDDLDDDTVYETVFDRL